MSFVSGVSFSYLHDFSPKKSNVNYYPTNKEVEKKPHPPVPKLNFEFSFNNENDPQQSSRPRPPKAKGSHNPRYNRAPHSSRTVERSPIIKESPISSREAKQDYSMFLTQFEMKEIDDFGEIYYLGIISKKNRGILHTHNHGFDDANYHYKIIVGDHIAYRYEIREVFGKGAFGQVLKCFDHKTKVNVALKIIINTQQMHEQGRVEISILNELNHLDTEDKNHIVRSSDAFCFRNHLCVSFEILGSNLYEFSKSIRFQPMSLKQIQSLSKQMLKALEFCHANSIVHCDMKPENVLLTPGSSNKCKLIDFGSSCYFGQQKYEYIQSRFYRAPEVILGITYGPPMDIWSFACIIVEMMIGRPIFPGDDEHEQLEMIMEVFGPPPRNMILASKRRREFFDSDLKPLLKNKRKRLRIPGASSLRSITKLGDPMFIDFLSKCLEWDQYIRITAKDALNHPWFNTVKVVSSARGASVRASYRLPGLR